MGTTTYLGISPTKNQTILTLSNKESWQKEHCCMGQQLNRKGNNLSSWAKTFSSIHGILITE